MADEQEKEILEEPAEEIVAETSAETSPEPNIIETTDVTDETGVETIVEDSKPATTPIVEDSKPATTPDEEAHVEVETKAPPAEPKKEDSVIPKNVSKQTTRRSAVSFTDQDEIMEVKYTEEAPKEKPAKPGHPSKRAAKDTQEGRTKHRITFASSLQIRRSGTGIQDRPKVPKLLNTYKLESDQPFHVENVEKILVDILNQLMEEVTTYSAEISATKAKWASDQIRTRVKEMEFARYKLICLVTIGEKRSYDLLACVRFLWDGDRDKYVSCTSENMQIFAIATVFGVYYE